VGSAGAPTVQSRFDGSDRQGRGRLIASLRTAGIPAGGVAAACGWPDDPERAARVVSGLVEEGLVVADRSGGLRLP
jgi:A/G-specific adenine glycosylase